MGGGGNFTDDNETKPAVQAPTVGRVVHVLTPQRDVPLAGTIAYVHVGSHNDMINIGAFDENGRALQFTSVPHRNFVNQESTSVSWIYPPRV